MQIEQTLLPLAPSTLRTRLSHLRHDRRGAAFVEYLIIVGIVALLGIAIFNTFRGHINNAAEGQGGQIDSLGAGG